MFVNRSDIPNFGFCKFSFIKEIGSGSFSKVFEVSSGRCSKLALKCPNQNGSIEKEGRLLKDLNKEEQKEAGEYVIQCIAFVRLENESFGLLTPLYETNLYSFVKTTEKGLSVEKTLRITKQLLDVASFLKKQKVIHRDIKPANIFMQGEKLRLGDFGLAINRKEDTRSIRGKSGTKKYLSPEIVTWDKPYGTPYGFPSDMWAIACTIYFTLSNNYLFEWNTIRGYSGLYLDQHDLFGDCRIFEIRMNKISINKSSEEIGGLQEILKRMLILSPESRLAPEAGAEFISGSEFPNVTQITDLTGEKRPREEGDTTLVSKRTVIEADRT